MKWLTCNNGKCSDTAWRDAGLLVLRLALAVVFILHGYDKLFGATTITGFAGFLTKLSVPLPEVFAWIVSIVEFVGGIAVLLGVFVRPAAALIAINMAFAFMLTKGSLPKGDLDFALFAIALALALSGGGRFALMKSKCCESTLANQ